MQKKNELKDQILIVGDVAGRYNELMELSEKAQECFGDHSLISVGDLCDRGKNTKGVIQAFIDNPDWRSVRGNHEDMMIDWCRAQIEERQPEYNAHFRWSVWLGNGGDDTLQSYSVPSEDPDVAFDTDVPLSHIEYLESCPLYIEHEDSFGKFVVTHGPINPVWGLKKCAEVDQKHDWSLCWNRGAPRRIKGVDMQFHGHNALRGVRWESDSLGKFCCNMDTSRGRILTGVLWPTYEIVQVPYEETVEKPPAHEPNSEEW